MKIVKTDINLSENDSQLGKYMRFHDARKNFYIIKKIF
tara:strand:+ start:3308 stop:3421 length:114 start_codon:yes stop_codon:yes gene_type:complete